jgi:hypothetical protein
MSRTQIVEIHCSFLQIVIWFHETELYHEHNFHLFPDCCLAIIEQIQKVVNDILRSFDLENHHENLEEQEDSPFDYFLQSTAWLLCN